MSWAKFDDQVAFHAKVIKAGNEAVGAWMRMIAHSCAQLTDGLIERDVALAIAPKRVLDRLVTVVLLEADGRNYRIHDFHDWNPPASVVREKREADKARKAAGRSVQVRDESGRMATGRPPSVRADTERIPHDRPPVPSPSPSPFPEIKTSPVVASRSDLAESASTGSTASAVREPGQSETRLATVAPSAARLAKAAGEF